MSFFDKISRCLGCGPKDEVYQFNNTNPAYKSATTLAEPRPTEQTTARSNAANKTGVVATQVLVAPQASGAPKKMFHRLNQSTINIMESFRVEDPETQENQLQINEISSKQKESGSIIPSAFVQDKRSAWYLASEWTNGFFKELVTLIGDKIFTPTAPIAKEITLICDSSLRIVACTNTVSLFTTFNPHEILAQKITNFMDPNRLVIETLDSDPYVSFSYPEVEAFLSNPKREKTILTRFFTKNDTPAPDQNANEAASSPKLNCCSFWASLTIRHVVKQKTSPNHLTANSRPNSATTRFPAASNSRPTTATHSRLDPDYFMITVAKASIIPTESEPEIKESGSIRFLSYKWKKCDFFQKLVLSVGEKKFQDSLLPSKDKSISFQKASLEAAPMYITKSTTLICDSIFTVLATHQSLLPLTKYSSDDIIEKDITKFIAPEDIPNFEAFLKNPDTEKVIHTRFFTKKIDEPLSESDQKRKEELNKSKEDSGSFYAYISIRKAIRAPIALPAFSRVKSSTRPNTAVNIRPTPAKPDPDYYLVTIAQMSTDPIPCPVPEPMKLPPLLRPSTTPAQSLFSYSRLPPKHISVPSQTKLTSPSASPNIKPYSPTFTPLNIPDEVETSSIECPPPAPGQYRHMLSNTDFMTPKGPL